RNILVVDDVPENQWILQLHLSRKGMLADFAQNGEQAVEKALTGQYDVILMDMQMPVMDGFTAARILRERGYTKPIVALTAHAMKDDKARCISAGCDSYL